MCGVLRAIRITQRTYKPSLPPSVPPSLPQANALVMELLGKPIPSYLNRLASFGSFFSCFLPADMTSQAPVNQGTYRLSHTHTHTYSVSLSVSLSLSTEELVSVSILSLKALDSPPLFTDPRLHTPPHRRRWWRRGCLPLCATVCWGANTDLYGFWW